MPRLAVVFGAAGFIGSNICRALATSGWHVRAVDGLLPRTSADRKRIDGINGVEFTACITDHTPEVVQSLIDRAELVIDAMGWTKHLEAIKDPAYDLRLNVGSHLPLMHAMAAIPDPPRLVLSLGSRHQYGRPSEAFITEDSPQNPVDVQGVHKIAAEQHWRLFATADKRVTVVSLRFGNTFGPGQPNGDGDIGLIGGFFRSVSAGEPIRVFGAGRRRNIVFAPDIAEAICRLADLHLPPGFMPLNMSGRDVAIRDLASAVIAACGQGELVEESVPEHIARMDIGEAELDDSRLRSLIGAVPMAVLATAMQVTAKDLAARSS